jgi:hypothetical protein
MDSRSPEDSHSPEKYAVCPHRNSAAAFRWFYGSLSALVFVKGRSSPRPAYEIPTTPRPRIPPAMTSSQ